MGEGVFLVLGSSLLWGPIPSLKGAVWLKEDNLSVYVSVSLSVSPGPVHSSCALIARILSGDTGSVPCPLPQSFRSCVTLDTVLHL